MATTITTTTTHTCDLCNKEYPREALCRLRLIQIIEDSEPEDPPAVKPSADVCADCRSNNTIAELVRRLEEIRTRQLFREGRPKPD